MKDMEEKMCKYCDPDSNERRVFNVCFSHTYYLSTETLSVTTKTVDILR